MVAVVAQQAKLPPLTLKWPIMLGAFMEGYGGDGDPLKGDRAKRRRYYVAFGGRGSAKSWTVARALLLQGLYDPLRILCAREIMRTIADSVHQLLADQIVALGLQDWYSVQDNEIVGVNGTRFIFAGLRALNVHNIKSYEGVDIVWVEEGQAVSKRSWGILVPTIRADGSEIWVTFNPELETDDTYVRFVVQPPRSPAFIQRVTFRDNPWFPKVLEDERLDLKARDPEEYEYVWEGRCRSSIAGAIYGREMARMTEERRIRPVPYDATLPVHTVWDLGWADACSIICFQQIHSEVRVIRYFEGSGLKTGEWVAELQKWPYAWGTDWLPHDGANTARQTGIDDKTVLERLGRKVNIVERHDVEAGIRRARDVFPRAYIDDENGAGLVDCLRKYRRGIASTTGEPGNPVHDAYSHGADAWRGLGQIVEKVRNELEMPKIVVPKRPSSGRRMGY